MAAAESEHGGEVHVLLLPYPSQGHINPILQFGKRLASYGGVRCTLAVTRFLLVQDRDPCPGAVHLAEISDGFDRGRYVVSQFVGVDGADHVLVNSFHKLQPQESEYMASMWGAKTVGPTVPSAYLDNRLPDDVSYGFHLHKPTTAMTKAWLDAQPPRSVAYVSFGSIAKPGPEQMAEVAEGLYNSGKAFLWVVRALETSKIPEGFADRVGGRGPIVTWTAQLEVLAHGAVGCFVTHCGWNSTTEALGAGVPMVAMPQWSDQPTNAKYIKDVWRVDVRARQDDGGLVRREELERCVRAVMEGDTCEEYLRMLSSGNTKPRAPWAKEAAQTRISWSFCVKLDQGKPGNRVRWNIFRF